MTVRVGIVAVSYTHLDVYKRQVHTSAPITAPGAAPLKSRLIAAAKLMVAMRAEDGLLPDALLADRAA